MMGAAGAEAAKALKSFGVSLGFMCIAPTWKRMWTLVG